MLCTEIITVCSDINKFNFYEELKFFESQTWWYIKERVKFYTLPHINRTKMSSVNQYLLCFWRNAAKSPGFLATCPVFQNVIFLFTKYSRFTQNLNIHPQGQRVEGLIDMVVITMITFVTMCTNFPIFNFVIKFKVLRLLCFLE